MSATEVTEFRHLLLEQQRKLLGRKAALRAAREAVDLDQTMVGRLSRIDAVQGQAIAQETVRRRGLSAEKD